MEHSQTTQHESKASLHPLSPWDQLHPRVLGYRRSHSALWLSCQDTVKAGILFALLCPGQLITGPLLLPTVQSVPMIGHGSRHNLSASFQDCEK